MDEIVQRMRKSVVEVMRQEYEKVVGLLGRIDMENGEDAKNQASIVLLSNRLMSIVKAFDVLREIENSFGPTSFMAGIPQDLESVPSSKVGAKGIPENEMINMKKWNDKCLERYSATDKNS